MIQLGLEPVNFAFEPMKHKLNFQIDRLTECIESTKTGDIFETEVIPVTKADLKTVLKKNGWNFKWKHFLLIPEVQVYKLVIKDDPDKVIQGLISFKPEDGFIELLHIENAPHNFGAAKEYDGVCGNLVAFGCKTSFDMDFGGYVAFTAKTKLVDHYIKTLNADLIPGRSRLAIFPKNAKKLVNLYFKNHL